jgi:tetratricopeptide (TPR) repeat protein
MADQRVSPRVVRARFPTLRDDHLRSLAQWGLVEMRRDGKESGYSFADLAVLRDVQAGLEDGRTFRAIVRGMLAERQGQLSLFGARSLSTDQPAPPRVVRLAERVAATAGAATDPRAGDRDRAEAIFNEATARDAEPDASPELAMALYREALTLDPTLVPALVNLGNLHYAEGHLPEAHALYDQAVRLDPDAFEAWFNLGNVHHDLGRCAEAVTCYQRALAMAPEYADACFYLAVAYEKLGESARARPHWQQYLRLAPEGEWASLAREFSE